jgi:DNA-binding NtrC family response regulator
MAFLLVVDDDETVRENLCDLFAGEHFCQAAESAEKAIALLSAERFDLVMTDISMPGMSGIELLGHVRGSQPDTPVIIISGINDQEYAAGLLKLGAYDFLLKPFQLEEVEASVASAIEHHRRLLKARRKHSVEEKQRPYALSIFAANARSSGEETAHEARVVLASSVDDAKQKGFELVHEKYPRGEGWISHNVAALEIERDFISQAASLFAKEDSDE